MTSKGHIYMIWTPLDNSFCYIGSTFNRLAKRWQNHKDSYKSKYGSISIHKYFDKYGIENFKLDLIKSYDCVRKHQKDFKHLHAYETLWINKTKNCINKNIPFSPMRYLNRKEYYKNNTDKCKELNKEYYKNNKERLLENQKKKVNCECGGKYTKCHKLQHLKTKKHQKFLENQKKEITKK